MTVLWIIYINQTITEVQNELTVDLCVLLNLFIGEKARIYLHTFGFIDYELYH